MSNIKWQANEEVLAIYFASRGVVHKAIQELLVLKLQTPARSIHNKIRKLNEEHKSMRKANGDWSLSDVDRWIREHMTGEQMVEELTHWDADVESTIAKHQELYCDPLRMEDLKRTTLHG
ncbi:hypothetical protein MMC28_001940 [Mycoblastus sanguinarius]|nr:hypothetical protein [Mycoblastus sanguinarius]